MYIRHIKNIGKIATLYWMRPWGEDVNRSNSTLPQIQITSIGVDVDVEKSRAQAYASIPTSYIPNYI